jgi:tetratricopeptide (TPR) repeat protein
MYRSAAAQARESGEPAMQPALYLARYLVTLARYSEAVAALEPVAASEPDNAEAHRVLGRAFDELEQFEKSARHLALALRLEPSNQQTRYSYARVLRRLGRTADSDREFEILRNSDR